MRFFSLIVFAALLASAQPSPQLLLHQEFEVDVTPWSALGPGTVVEITHQPAQTHSGNGALALTYAVKRGQIVAAVMPAPQAFAHMQALSFWVKADQDTPGAVLLSENKPNGGNYTAWFWAPANTWQRIDLKPADFVLSDGPADPKDADGRLDLDQIQAVGILPISSYLATVPDPTTHTLCIDDLQVKGDSAAAPSSMSVDNFDRGFLPWIGAVNMKLAGADNPLHEPALEASYDQHEPPLPSLIRRIANRDLAKAARLDFDVASDQAATLVIALEVDHPGSAQGPRYNLPIYPPTGREVFHVSVKLEDFQGPGKLDPSQLKSLIVTDATAAGDGVGVHNRIWIGKVEFRPER